MSVCQIKICGMLSRAEMSAAMAAGADFIGFVCDGLTPPGCLSDEAFVAMVKEAREASRQGTLQAAAERERAVAERHHRDSISRSDDSDDRRWRMRLCYAEADPLARCGTTSRHYIALPS